MRQSKLPRRRSYPSLKEADAGRPINEIWRKYRISSANHYKWKTKYGGLEASDIKRLKELEDENGHLKRMYAELSLENTALKKTLQKALRPAERWEVVAHMVSQSGLPPFSGPVRQPGSVVP